MSVQYSRPEERASRFTAWLREVGRDTLFSTSPANDTEPGNKATSIQPPLPASLEQPTNPQFTKDEPATFPDRQTPSQRNRNHDYDSSQERPRRPESRNSFSSFIRSAGTSIRRMSVGSRSSMSLGSQASGSSRVANKESRRVEKSDGKANYGHHNKKRRRQSEAAVQKDAEEGLGSILSRILSQFKRRKEDGQERPVEDAENVMDFLEDLSIEDRPRPSHEEEDNISGAPASKSPLGNTVSSSMSIEEVIAILNDHQCRDLTRDLDEATCSSLPIRGGGFGDIYRGKLRNGSQVAIKCTRLYVDSDERSRRALKEVARELYIWSKCVHFSIARLLGVAQFRNQIAMISYWMENGTLPNYLNENALRLDQKYKLCMQVAGGVDYFHNLGIVHGDVRGANVLISETGDAKLTDFGNSTLKNHALQYSGASFKPDYSLRWAAPEIIKGDERSSKKGDVYALGMTILEILTGDIPYAGKSDYTVLYLVTVMKESPSLPASTKRQICDLLRKCWEHDPAKRPPAITVFMLFCT